MKNVGIDQALTTKNRSKRGVALHEAGHFAVAKQLGFAVLGLTIRRDHPRLELHSGHAHIGTISPIANDTDLENYLRARIAVLLAGGLAQAFDGSTVNARRLVEIREDNAADDMGKARELFVLHLNRRIAEGEGHEFAQSDSWERHPFWQQCEDDALTILRKHWLAIERIAADIEKNVHSHCWNYDPPLERILALGWPGDGAATA